jgi:hypothetical protein
MSSSKGNAAGGSGDPALKKKKSFVERIGLKKSPRDAIKEEAFCTILVLYLQRINTNDNSRARVRSTKPSFARARSTKQSLECHATGATTTAVRERQKAKEG